MNNSMFLFNLLKLNKNILIISIVNDQMFEWFNTLQMLTHSIDYAKYFGKSELHYKGHKQRFVSHWLHDLKTVPNKQWPKL